MLKRIIAVSLVLVLGVPAGARAAVPAGCHPGSAADAARALIHPGARVLMAGASEAAVLAPLVAPGTPFTLLRGDGVWCDAQAGFNHVRPPDALAAAEAFARTAATPWFGRDVWVVSAERAGDVVTLVTHARRNGVRARWQIAAGPHGIEAAEWVATHFAVRPFEPEIEGLTALPGLRHAWKRIATGLLVAREPIVPTGPAPGIEGLQARAVLSDGFVIEVRRTNGPGAVTFTEDTGIDELDLPRFVRRVTVENYEEFLDWGFVGNAWDSPVGYVYLDDINALRCLACVFIRRDFQIHMNSKIVPIARYAFGYDWTDDAKGFSSILGHEMFHNFQNAAMQVDPNLGFADPAYSEGTARMSEALHTYSHASHVPRSDIYSPDANGCNGYVSGGSYQAGPATNRYYESCAFWLAWYGDHGVGALWDLLEAMAGRYTIADPWQETRGAIFDVTGGPVVDDLAHFAGAIITRRGYRWGPAVGGGPVLDWGLYLAPWQPPLLKAGESTDALLEDGGMIGFRLARAGTVTYSSDEPVSLFEIRDTGSSTTVTARASGASIAAPPAGGDVYVVLIYAGLDVADVSLSFSA